MKNDLFILLLLGAAGVIGATSLSGQRSETTRSFDYNSATPAERTAHLESLGSTLTRLFKPNYVARPGDFSTGGRSLTLNYNMRMSKIDCDTDYSCEILQCSRYLKSPASANNISVRLRYLNIKGQQTGGQLLKNSSCQKIVDNWQAALEREQARAAKSI